MKRATSTGLALLAVLLAGCSDITAPVDAISHQGLARATTTLPAGGLKDTFAGSTLDAGLWDTVAPAGWVAQQDRLVVTPTANVADAGVLFSHDLVDLTGSGFSVEISQVAGGHSSVETYVAVVSADWSEFAAVTSFGGRLYGYIQRRGQSPRAAGSSIPLDPSAHRFRRVRESGGTIYLETSANGVSWATRWTVANFFQDLRALHGNLGVRSPSANGNPTPAHFEGVNTLVPAAPSKMAAVVAGPGVVELSWTDRSVNESGFQVERRAAGGTFGEIATVSANAIAHVDSTVSPETTYEYRVRGLGSEGASAYAAVASVSTPTESEPEPEPEPTTPPLGAISDAFIGSTVDEGRWTVHGPAEWVTQDDRIIIQPAPSVAEYGGLLYALPHTLTGSAFSAEISRISTGSRYTETLLSVTTDDLEEYVVITSLDGRLEAHHQWRGESWAQVGGSLTYDPVAHRFRRIREEGGFVYFEVSSDGTNWTNPSGWSVRHEFESVSGLHGFIAAGVYDGANPTPSPAHFEGVNTTIPSTPAGFSATATAHDRIELGWTDVAVNETGYRLERRTVGGAFQEIASLPAGATIHVDTLLAPETAYEYRLRAHNGLGTTAFVGPVSAVTAAEPEPEPEPEPVIGLAGVVDPFNGNKIDPGVWDVVGPTGWVTQNHRLSILPAPNDPEPAGLLTALPHAFTGSSFAAEIGQVAGGSRWTETFVAVVSPDLREFVTMTSYDGGLHAYIQRAGRSPQRLGKAISFSASAHRFRRIREEDSMVYLETSANGIDWTVRWTTSNFFQDPGALLGNLGVRSDPSNGNPTPAHIEGVNTTAP